MTRRSVLDESAKTDISQESPYAPSDSALPSHKPNCEQTPRELMVEGMCNHSRRVRVSGRTEHHPCGKRRDHDGRHAYYDPTRLGYAEEWKCP